jgi:hypothetical protein
MRSETSSGWRYGLFPGVPGISPEVLARDARKAPLLEAATNSIRKASMQRRRKVLLWDFPQLIIGKQKKEKSEEINK